MGPTVCLSTDVSAAGAKLRWEVIGLYEEADKVRAEPFDAIELDLSLLWSPTPPAPPAPPSP